MIEVTGNLWDYEADAIVITTNGTVKKNGSAVMGRGCAFEAKQRFPGLDALLGARLTQANMNIPFILHQGPPALISFPVKHNWWEKADIDLIKQSAYTLAGLCAKDNAIVMPRPGCGNGKLDWCDVRKVLEPILDDRFHVITFRS